MATINFRKEDKDQLESLAVKFLFDGTTLKGALSTEVTVYELIQHTSVNVLKNILVALKKEIDAKENQDRWSLTDNEQKVIESLRDKRDFVDLLIGYKKYLSELSGMASKKATLMKQLKELEESTKKPEDRIAEIKKAIEELN